MSAFLYCSHYRPDALADNRATNLNLYPKKRELEKQVNNSLFKIVGINSIKWILNWSPFLELMFIV